MQLTAFLCLTSFSFVTSWTDRRKQQSEKVNLTVLFDKYVPPCLEVCRSRFRKITPIADIAHIHMLCHLLDCLLTPANTPADCPKEWYEIYFVFACVWAFGSALCQDQVCIHLECVSFLTCYSVHSLCRYGRCWPYDLCHIYGGIKSISAGWEAPEAYFYQIRMMWITI